MNSEQLETTEVIAFLPCRTGSQRVPKKNTRPFSKAGKSLFDIKIAQLVACPRINQIVVSTNDPNIKSKVMALQPHWKGRIILDHRPDHLCLASTSTDALIGYLPTIIQNGHVLWTHVTSPFVNADDYSTIIDAYFTGIASGEYTSLMSVTKLQTFLWGKTGPINYDRKQEKWPRTQTLTPVFEVNSAAFMASARDIKNTNDRITDRVQLFEIEKAKCIDIDHMDEFILAAKIYETVNIIQTSEKNSRDQHQ
ncbi:MAG: CMP-N-acetylneuraminic acid [Beijerinckiaceae bacterium]|nr:MAG: CMP-N-acetylneuraminic acid [Beijerinckiaceae bacterium]